MFFKIFLRKETKKKKRRDLDIVRKAAKEILSTADETAKKKIDTAKERAKKIIDEAKEERKKLREDEKKSLEDLKKEIEEKKKENEEKKKENKLLENRIHDIEKLLEDTKLTDFLDYLGGIKKGCIELKGMIASLDEDTSFSTKVVSETRIEERIQLLLNRTKEMEKRIRVFKASLDKS